MAALSLIASATPALAVTWAHTSSIDTDANNQSLTVSSAGTAAVVSHNSDSVTLFNSTSGALIATVAVGDGPTVASFTRDGSTLAVLNETAQTVSLINVSSHTVASTFNVEEGARSANITPNGKAVYSGNYIDRFINVYSARSGLLIKQIDIGSADNLWVSFGKRGKFAYVSAQGSSEIAVVNVKKKRNIYDIPLTQGSPGISAISPNGRYLAVPLFDEGLGIKVVDLKQKRVAAYFETPGHNPQTVTFSADGDLLYATDSANGTIWTIDMTTLTLADTDIVWAAGLNGLILSADNSFAYLSNSSVNSLWKVTIS